MLPIIGRVKLHKLTPIQIQRMQVQIASERSNRAANAARRLVHNFLDDALKLGLTARNAAAAVDPVRYNAPEFTIWTAEEIVRFMAAVLQSEYHPFYYLALTTGMRPGELIALHWEDIDGDKLRVHRGVSQVKNKLNLGTTKTHYGRRVLTLPEDTARLMERHREGAEGELVFPSRRGTFLLHGSIRRNLELFAGKAKVTVIRPHDLRHTYASMRIADGADVMRLSRELGHANPGFTLQKYGHLFERHQKRDAPSLNRLLGLEEASQGYLKGNPDNTGNSTKEPPSDLPS